MKHLLSALFIVLFTFAFGQSNLTVFNNGGQQFYVILNGVKQNFQPMTNVVVSGLKNGSYSVKLIFADQKIPDVDKNFYIDEPQDITTRVIFKKKLPKLQWIGAVPTAGASQSSDVIIYRPDDNTMFSDQQVNQVATTPTGTVNTTGNLTTNTTGTLNTTGNVNTNGNVNITGNVNGNNGAVNSQSNGGTVSQTTTTQTTTTTTGTPTTSTNTPNGIGGMNISINVNDPLNGGGQINMNMGGIGTAITTQDAQTTQQSTTVTTTTVTSSSTNNGNTTITTTDTNPIATQGNVGIQMNTNPASTQGNVGIQMNTNMGTTTQGNTTFQSTNTQSNTQFQNTNTQGNTTIQSNNTQTTQTPVQPTSTNGYCKNILADANRKVEELNELSFDSDRKEAILMELKTYCLTASQAYQILEVLDFESDRLECAKFLSDRIIDKDNVGILYKLFDFDSSKMELRQYISSKK
jgi:hypothetical protein